MIMHEKQHKENLPNMTFLDLLKKEYLQRARKNPSYSMRAFSSFLGISPSLLSRVFKGDRRLTPKAIEQMGKRLCLKPSDIRNYQRIVKLDLFSSDDSFIYQEDDVFEHVSGWHNFALLEMLKYEELWEAPSKIARRLGIKPIEVTESIRRLVKLGIVKKEKNDQYKITSEDNSFINNFDTSDARKKLQKDWLSLAIDAINEVEFEERDNSAMTLAIHKDLIPDIKKRIFQFRREIEGMARAYSKKPNEVYQVCIAAFPLTKNQNVEKEMKE